MVSQMCLFVHIFMVMIIKGLSTEACNSSARVRAWAAAHAHARGHWRREGLFTSVFPRIGSSSCIQLPECY